MNDQTIETVKLSRQVADRLGILGKCKQDPTNPFYYVVDKKIYKELTENNIEKQQIDGRM